jgi:hypothetical protein
MTGDTPPLPPRIVHLLGGLRAVDDQSQTVSIQVARDQRFAQLPTPPYPDLYGQLLALGLRPIGVEFVNSQTYRGLEAPDWECASAAEAFKIRKERNLWTEVRHAAVTDRRLEVVDMASRAATYLDLLPLRILQLSEAYNKALRAKRADGQKDDTLFFQNSFNRYIDAAIHGFVADAASFRDLIAESVWKLVLNEQASVTTLATFLKKAASHSHPLAQSIVMAGQDGGWLKNLTSLRNHITHVAPVGRASDFHFCAPRRVKIGPDIEAIALHYPLLDATGAVRQEPDPIDYNDEADLRAKLERYRQFSETSIDALEYAWTTLGQLVDLLAEMRVASGLRSEAVIITDDDLVGEITFL